MTTTQAHEGQWEAFGAEIDQVRKRVEATIGEDDVRHLKRLTWISRGFEALGRGLIHFSFEPLSFSIGVLSLAVHKQLHGSEIGHAVLHGAYDKLPGAQRYQSKNYWWETPIDEESWRRGHNVLHHQYTNVVGKDPDCQYGTIRLNPEVSYKDMNHHQELHPLYIWPSFTFNMSAHFTGLVDFYLRDPQDYDVLPDRKRATVIEAHRKWLRKVVPYYAKEYVAFPALAGPFFWKVMLGNWLAEMMRSVYSAATIFTGHVGAQTMAFPEGTRARSRAQWYAMQVRAANNFEVPRWLSVLCGGLDHQIEHHLFPKWPPERLREVAPEIREICERHGIAYKTGSWASMLRKVFGQLRRLGKKPAKVAAPATSATPNTQTPRAA